MRPGAVVANNSITFYGPITTSGDVYTAKVMGIKSGTLTPAINGAGYSQSGIGLMGYIPPRDGYFAISNSSSGRGDRAGEQQHQPVQVLQRRGQTVRSGPHYHGYGHPHRAARTCISAACAGQPRRRGLQRRTSSPLVLSDNQTINGTLVVEGDLQIKGTNITINPQPGFPALIVTGNLEIYQSGRNLTSNGLTYIGGQLKSNNNGLPAPPQSLASTFTVNGGLIFGSSSVVPIPTTYNVKTLITYNATKARAPDLSTALRQPTGVSIVRWGLP
jgi:hypothetical protein